jgi:hypothetical protein
MLRAEAGPAVLAIAGDTWNDAPACGCAIHCGAIDPLIAIPIITAVLSATLTSEGRPKSFRPCASTISTRSLNRDLSSNIPDDSTFRHSSLVR